MEDLSKTEDREASFQDSIQGYDYLFLTNQNNSAVSEEDEGGRRWSFVDL